MRYTIRWLHNGRVHYLHTDAFDTAITAYEACANAGYAVALWQGTEELRPEAKRAKNTPTKDWWTP